MTTFTTDEELRFWSRVDAASPDACWNWRGKTDKAGYGRFYFRGRSSFPAHRISWAVANGRMPLPGAYVCHRCDNPSCVNPTHLFEGSPKDNHVDMVRKGRASFEEDHCRNGHALTDGNVTVRPNGDRRCWTCMRAREREWRAENRDRLNAKQRERYAEKKRRELAGGAR